MKDFFVLSNIAEIVQKMLGENIKIVSFYFTRDYCYRVVANTNLSTHIYVYNHWDRKLIFKSSKDHYIYKGY